MALVVFLSSQHPNRLCLSCNSLQTKGSGGMKENEEEFKRLTEVIRLCLPKVPGPHRQAEAKH